MILRPSSSVARHGMTLLEVMLALAIFLFSLIAISQLFNTATRQATDVALMSRATRLAQSKLAEYSSGVLSLTAGGQGDFEEDMESGWTWQSEVQADGTAAGLYLVSVTVTRDGPGDQVKTRLTQYILDPRMKGNIPAQVTPTTSSATGTDSSSSSSSTASSSSSGSSASGSSNGGSTSSGAKAGTTGSSGGATGGTRTGGTGTPSGGMGMPSGGTTAPSGGTRGGTTGGKGS